MSDKSPEQSPADILSTKELSSEVKNIYNLTTVANRLKKKEVTPEFRKQTLDTLVEK